MLNKKNGEKISSETENLDTIFVRHKMRATDEIIEWLWENDRIALHWLNSAETDPEYYKENCDSSRAYIEIRYLNKYANEGAIVGAYYGNEVYDYRGKMKVGKIPSGTEIKIQKFDVPEREEDLIYKTVQLKETEEINLSDYPALFTAKPRQGWSICQWHQGEKLLRSVKNNKKLELDLGVKSLSSGQLEVVCNMYLKLIESDYHELMPLGRTLEDVDIIAINHEDKTKILAQVTHSSDVEQKIKILKNNSAPDVRLYFFGPKEKKPAEKTLKDVYYHPIEDVFKELTSDENSKIYKTIESMLN